MPKYHEAAELAPRDVVARAIAHELELVKRPDAAVYLDLTHLNAERVRTRFPMIYSTCMDYNIDIASELVPVRPAAHYAMGGVRTDLDGKTSLPGLYAAGEVACTGVHGANRLASNSLLEGLVYGARAAQSMRETLGTRAKRAVSAVPAGCAAKRKWPGSGDGKIHPEGANVDVGACGCSSGREGSATDGSRTACSAGTGAAAERSAIP